MNFGLSGAQPIEGPFKSYEEAVKNLIKSWDRATLIEWYVEATNIV